MTSLQELSSYLDDLLDAPDMKDYCPNGLQVEGKKEINKVLFAVTASEKAIQHAVSENCDALIVHHGIFWNGASMRVQGSLKKRLQPLLQNEISLLAYHLPLDAHPEFGNNFGAGKKLNMHNPQPFAKIGVHGSIPPTNISTFVEQLEALYQHPAHKALGGKETIETVAIVSGGGWRHLEDAIEKNIDCLISGSFDEPAWHLAHENNIHFIALGHDATEQVGVQLLKEHLSEKFEIETLFLDLDNPF